MAALGTGWGRRKYTPQSPILLPSITLDSLSERLTLVTVPSCHCPKQGPSTLSWTMDAKAAAGATEGIVWITFWFKLEFCKFDLSILHSLPGLNSLETRQHYRRKRSYDRPILHVSLAMLTRSHPSFPNCSGTAFAAGLGLCPVCPLPQHPAQENWGMALQIHTLSSVTTVGSVGNVLQQRPSLQSLSYSLNVCTTSLQLINNWTCFQTHEAALFWGPSALPWVPAFLHRPVHSGTSWCHTRHASHDECVLHPSLHFITFKILSMVFIPRPIIRHWDFKFYSTS